jgi:TonB family protein
MTRLGTALILALAFLAAPAGASPTDLEAVKARYAAADYDGALQLLARADGGDDVVQVEEYRALCLLALGRTPEAERSVERIFSKQPLYTVDSAQVPPRMIALVSQVRQRMVPVVARNLYGAARKNFEQKEYAAAVTQLTDMLAMVEAAGSAAPGLSDLKVLGEGFLELAQGQLAAVTAPPEVSGSPQPLGAPGVLRTGVYSDFLRIADEQSAAARAAMVGPSGSDPNSPILLRPDIYSDVDRIQPPVPVQRDVPRWTPPDDAARQTTHRGHVEIVVDETGAVESVAVADSVHADYDASLLEAARKWRYRPATRNGQPVRYRLLTEVVLRPSQP